MAKPSPAPALQQPTKSIVLVVSDKGGPGKTTFATLTADHVRNVLHQSLACFDGDGMVGGFFACLGNRVDGKLVMEQDPLTGCGAFDARTPAERNMVLDCVGGGYDRILLDLPGGANLEDVVDRGRGCATLLDAYRLQGYQVVVVNMISNVRAATMSLGRHLSLLGGDGVRHFAVVNRHFGETDASFPFFVGFRNGCGEVVGGNFRRQLLEGGGLVLDMPSLDSGVFAKAIAMEQPFTALVHDTRLLISERAQLQQFLRSFGVSITPLLSAIGIG